MKNEKAENLAEYLETCMRNRVISESFSEVIISLTKAEEIFALLKEQESVVPGLEQDADGIYWTCGNCKARLWKMFGVEFEFNPDAMPKFCPQCGKAVKWE